VNDERMSTSNTTHDEYIAETNKLVDEQIGALVIFMNLAVDRVALEAPSFTSLHVERHGNTISATMDASRKTATFAVTDAGDLPIAEKAALLAQGQARCVVKSPDGAEEVWVLGRTAVVRGGDGAENSPVYAEQGDAAPVYEWKREHDGAAIDVQVLTETLKTFFGERGGGYG